MRIVIGWGSASRQWGAADDEVAEEEGFTTLFVPAEDAPEASLIEDLTVYAVESLLHLINHLSGHKKMSPYEVDLSLNDEPLPYATDLSEIKGQENVKRAAEVAAAGGHNPYMFGTKTTPI